MHGKLFKVRGNNIKIENEDIRSLQVKWLRSQMGMV